MTGRGRGLCVLKLPPEPEGPVIGSAGRAGWPVGRPLDCQMELRQLHRQARHIEAALRIIHAGIEWLEGGRSQGRVGT
jgi:hypothetical protein